MVESQAAQVKKLKEICDRYELAHHHILVRCVLLSGFIWAACCFCVRREKKELQKILDRKRLNSISEAKMKEKDKPDM